MQEIRVTLAYTFEPIDIVLTCPFILALEPVQDLLCGMLTDMMWNVNLFSLLDSFQSKKTADKFRLLGDLCLNY